MAQNTDPGKPGPLVIVRIFSAPPERVFKAWSSADHMKRWFSPSTYTVPEAEIDFRAGGVCAICMRSPEGHDFWSRGTFTEISPPDRLAFTTSVAVAGSPKFTAHTQVAFEPDGDGTRMTVRQSYEIHDQDFSAAVAGAPEGWRTTLDKLEREVARIGQAPDGRSVVHSAFTIQRRYRASVEKVFRALTDKTTKSKWFGGGENYTMVAHEMDVRPGGRERAQGRWVSGVVTTFDAAYFDVVPNERIVYAYEMHVDDRRISVSLATLDIKADGEGTRLTVTEQGAFLDGYDDAGSREHGTGSLLDRLGASLDG